MRAAIQRESIIAAATVEQDRFLRHRRRAPKPPRQDCSSSEGEKMGGRSFSASLAICSPNDKTATNDAGGEPYTRSRTCNCDQSFGFEAEENERSIASRAGDG
ncbi:hypothetical protein MRX96_059087 [Rhipicephalus microplus]